MLLHSVSHYASWVGRPASQWDDRTFENRGDISYGTAPLAVLYPTYLHLAPAVYMSSVAAIDTSLAGYPNITLLGPYGAVDAGAQIICCCKTANVPAPYLGLLLGEDITQVEACNSLREAIVDAGAKTSCRPVIDWLRNAIV